MKDSLPKLTQEEMNDLNRPISIKETKSIIDNFPKQKVPGPDGVSGTVYQIFNDAIIPILYNLIHKIETDGALLNSLYEANITLISKLDKKFMEKGNYQLISHIPSTKR